MAAVVDTDKPEAPVVYARRWAVVAVFCLLNSTNAALWVTYAAISTRKQSMGHRAYVWGQGPAESCL